jgi:hypothetical protein
MESMASVTSDENVLTDQVDGLKSLEEQKPNGWKLMLHDANYASYSLMAVSPDRQLVAFGNLKGSIKVHETSKLAFYFI